jgi:G:T/U-mismatch repair DNA glycosylase
MHVVRHRFEQHAINPYTELLIIGTFNPETTENTADFFYGRPRNFLWTLVPVAFGDDSLKNTGKKDKLTYLRHRKFDFIDLIAEVHVEQPGNYADSYIDKNITAWNDIISAAERLQYLNKICFTRKTFSGIPNMKKRIETIKEFCKQKSITFQCLPTPARFYRADKQEEWTKFLTA